MYQTRSCRLLSGEEAQFDGSLPGTNLVVQVLRLLNALWPPVWPLPAMTRSCSLDGNGRVPRIRPGRGGSDERTRRGTWNVEGRNNDNTLAAPATTVGFKIGDMVERLVWTFVAAFTSALVSPPVAQAAGLNLSLTALDAAVLAGASAVVNFITVVARWRLSVLPDPGRDCGGTDQAQPPPD